MLRNCLTAMTALLLVIVFALPANAERIALIIGNSKYEHTTALANPSNDAKDMAKALQAVGFKVMLGLDLDRRAFDLKIRDYANALAEADDAIFYYAGHALQVGGQNYLIPVDAQLDRERDLDFTAVRLSFILRQMELERQDKTNIIILDACRDNPLARNLARSMGTRSTAVGVGLAQVKSGVGSFIAFSTQPGNVALDGSGRNSPFTAALVKRIPTPGQSINALMIGVRKDVLAATKGKQVPWDHSALTGDFYFAAGTSTATGQQTRKLISAETVVRIAQLRERIQRLHEEEKDIQQTIFQNFRDRASETDAKTRQKIQRDVMRLNIRKSRKIQQRLKLKAELTKLEKAANLESSK
ncbi:MAG: caspase family protein [Hyphomicrobiaceae bacterium]